MKDKLEVGMYVRTKHNGIGKIVEYINDPTHYFFKCYKLDRNCFNCEEYITKSDVILEPSHNIIDLIERFDLVNGHLVICKMYENEKDIPTIVKCVGDYYFKEEDIKSIVTKEQMEQMAYKVGE